ncbi:MAG: hypothetical protein AAGA61_07290 [Pseudomonadota bacterium]
MSEQKTDEAPAAEPAEETPQESPQATQSGPTFNESPDPLAGAKKAAGDAWQQTEGKTVSMRVYIGSIAAVIVLMLLARCGG